MKIDIAYAQRDGRTYLRGPTGEWCWAASVAANAGADASPFGALDALRRSGARFDYIGQEKVRGVETGHFRVAGASPRDLWVDAQDRLRRMAATQPTPRGTVAFTDEFFDFGAPVHATLPPSNAPECEHA
jgi:hypothetical protein